VDLEHDVSLGIGSRPFPRGSHICYLFDDDVERLPIVARYLEAGKRAREKLIYIVDVMAPEELRRRLGDLSNDLAVPPALLAVRASDAYFPAGRFAVEDMLELIRSFAEQAIAEGFSGARGTGELSWIARGVEGSERILDYEVRLTSLLRACARSSPCAALCQYDMRLFSGEMVMDVLAVHPYTMVRGQIVENPFFIEPDEFQRSRAPARPSVGARPIGRPSQAGR
jgi:hypothetical protein